jgi:hypothetical protein
MKKLHLDSEYRDRWIEFHLLDGTIEDSRLKNWREVDWNRVVQITVHMLNHVHVIRNSGKGFLTFMNFRWGGFAGHVPIKIWSVGWTDGENCFLKDISFYNGELLKEYITPLSMFKGHLHPDVKDRVLG